MKSCIRTEPLQHKVLKPRFLICKRAKLLVINTTIAILHNDLCNNVLLNTNHLTNLAHDQIDLNDNLPWGSKEIWRISGNCNLTKTKD